MPAPRAARSGQQQQRPTPIAVSGTVRNLLVAGLIAGMALICWAVPALLVVSLGGFALALVLSFPVHRLSQFLPRPLAIFIAFMLMILVVVLALLFLVPLIVEQLAAFVLALPSLIANLEQMMVSALDTLDRNGLLPGTPQETADRVGEEISTGLSVITDNFLGKTAGLVFGTFSFALTLFGVAFVGISLLANVRDFKATFLRETPHRYRRDARELWDRLAQTVSRYVGGLAFVMAVQGVVTGIALYLIGVPYPVALGAWTALTAFIPYFGAWIGAVPAVLLAFSISPTAVILTSLAYLAIQQLEGNILTPKIQGQTLELPSVAVFLVVIAGGALAGVFGMLFAVPALAVAHVLFRFFRSRLVVQDSATDNRRSTVHPPQPAGPARDRDKAP